ncbi:MAG TPA: (d)CMP kinase [Acidimicrobiales bacterium]|nr:(d)CMP kinase [Acidimicrobiales bacterium]
MRLVAIDGPAGSGKSTVARAVAGRLGLDYLDTGAMYRSVAFAVLRKGIDPSDADAVADLAAGLDITVAERVMVDGIDATTEIRSAEVTRSVSAVAANPRVRSTMVRRQREWAEAHGGGVIEGRDIGSVVFPDAELKVFLTADEAERARRRHEEDDIGRRDRLDSTRVASPLAVADGAVVIDTTGRTIDEVVEEVLARL